jgi:hypothetical protein
MRGERRKCGPEHSVIEQHPAVDRDERNPAGDRRRREYSELDSTGLYGLTLESRRARLRAAEVEKALIRRQVRAREGDW